MAEVYEQVDSQRPAEVDAQLFIAVLFIARRTETEESHVRS